MTLEVTFGIDDDDEKPVKLAAANEPVIMLEEVVLGRWSSWSLEFPVSRKVYCTFCPRALFKSWAFESVRSCAWTMNSCSSTIGAKAKEPNWLIFIFFLICWRAIGWWNGGISKYVLQAYNFSRCFTGQDIQYIAKYLYKMFVDGLFIVFSKHHEKTSFLHSFFYKMSLYIWNCDAIFSAVRGILGQILERNKTSKVKKVG